MLPSHPPRTTCLPPQMHPDTPHLPHRLTVTPSGSRLTHLVRPPSRSTIPFTPSRASTLASHPPRASTRAMSPTLVEHAPSPSYRLARPTPALSPSRRLTRPPSLFAHLARPLLCRLAHLPNPSRHLAHPHVISLTLPSPCYTSAGRH